MRCSLAEKGAMYLLLVVSLSCNGCGGAAERTAFMRVRELDGRIELNGKGIKIFLTNAKVTDNDLALLSGLTKLNELDLSNSKVTDAGLVNVLRLDELNKIYLRNTAVTPDGVKQLQAKFPMIMVHQN